MAKRKNTNKNTRRKREQRYVQMMLGGIAAVIVAAVALIFMWNKYRKEDKAYDEVEENYVSVVTPKKKEKKKDKKAETVPEPEKQWYDLISVNVGELKAQYGDVVGYIWFEDDSVSYPIMQCNDNEKYLSTSFEGKYAQSGSIFLDWQSSPDFNDAYTLIYGHNMKDESMFGSLKNYRKDENYIENHKYFQIITTQKKYRYEIFAYSVIDGNSDLYDLPGSQPELISEKLSMIRKSSKYKNDISVGTEDNIVNLSTCSGTENRFLVSAVRIDEADNIFEIR